MLPTSRRLSLLVLFLLLPAICQAQGFRSVNFGRRRTTPRPFPGAGADGGRRDEGRGALRKPVRAPPPPADDDKKAVAATVSSRRSCVNTLSSLAEAETAKLCHSVRLVYDFNCLHKETNTSGTWIQVNVDTCPIVFLDPSFAHHQEFCSGGIGGPLRRFYNGQSAWTWPGYGYCQSIPYILCPALRACRIFNSLFHDVQG